jgi:hypothetical protein
VSLQIDEDGGVSVAAPESPIIYPDGLGLWMYDAR